LGQCMTAEGVQIYIGSETPVSRSAGVSLITSRFVTGNNTVGLLGVIGPTRMGYSNVIPIVGLHGAPGEQAAQRDLTSALPAVYHHLTKEPQES